MSPPSPATAEVVFEPAGVRVEVQSGITILAASQCAGVAIFSGCTEGMCGTDPVHILAGQEFLSPPEDHEKGTLERMGLGVAFRLSCSARLLGGTVQVRTDAF